MDSILKYPRTPHIGGSRLQPGDDDLETVPFAALAGRYLIVEEKLDGANCGIRFCPDGQLLLQSRGHYLTGGPRERHFALLKSWAARHQQALHEAIGKQYLIYGEWLYAKHTVFYDALPHYFVEFDLLDTAAGEFLSTDRRCDLLQALPLVSAPVLWRGRVQSFEQLIRLVGPSRFRSGTHRERLRAVCRERGLDEAQVVSESDATDLMEGLYIKVEQDGRVVERFKYVRRSFVTTVVESGDHWLERPIVPNLLRAGADLFGEAS